VSLLSCRCRVDMRVVNDWWLICGILHCM